MDMSGNTVSSLRVYQRSVPLLLRLMEVKLISLESFLRYDTFTPHAFALGSSESCKEINKKRVDLKQPTGLARECNNVRIIDTLVCV